MQIERNSLSTIQDSDRSFEDYKGRDALVSSSEATGAAYDLAWQDTAVGLLARGGVVDQFEATGAKPLSPEEANKLYPGMAEPFREPVNPYVAQYQYDEQNRKLDLQRKIQEGPQDRWTSTKQFGVGLIAHMADPVEFGAGAMVGWGVGGIAARGGFGVAAAEAAAASQAGKATFGQMLLYEGIEAGGGSFIENVVQEAYQKDVEGREGTVDPRSMAEIGTDIMFGTVAAFGLQAGVKGIAKGISYSLEGDKRFMRGTSPEVDIAVARNIVQAAETGALPSPHHILDAVARETDVPHSVTGYVYEPITGGPSAGKQFYVSTKGKDFESAKNILGDDFGFGTHVSDNSGVANAASARSYADGVGGLHRVDIDSLNPLDLSAPPVPELAVRLNEIANKNDFPNLPDDLSSKQILEAFRNGVDAGHFPESILADVKKAIQDSGYDSMLSDGRSFKGVEHGAHNHLTVLDDSKLKPAESFEPNKDIRRNPSPDELDAARKDAEQPKEFLGAEEWYQNLKRELKETPLQDKKYADELATMSEELTMLDKQGLLDGEQKQALEQAKQILADSERGSVLIKAFKACTMRG